MDNFNLYMGNYRTQGARIFTGRDRGKQVREQVDLLNLITKNEKISITIPEDIITINPFFLEEFFYEVVVKLGKEGFYNKFEFISKGKYKIESNLETAVDRILRKNSSLK